MSDKSPLRPSITPRTFTRMQEFHRGLQKLASDPQYAFIYKFTKTFGPTTPYLEKGLQPILDHTGWNVTTGFINLIFYVAADKSEPSKRIIHSDENRRRFATLKQYSIQIESEFGAKLLWQDDISRSGMYQASVMVDPASMEIATNSNEKRWPAIQTAVLVTAKRLNDVLLKYLPYIDNPNLLAAKLKSSSATNTVSNTQHPVLSKAIKPTATIETAETAENLSGEKLYQQRARQALPILVRQAHANQTIFYSDLAQEIGMPNERNLNYVLGSIGKTLLQLSDKLNEKIPPIQCVVVNRQTGLPGAGIGWFMDKVRFSEMSKDEQAAITQAQLELVYQYPKWFEVLEHLELKPLQSGLSDLIAEATKRKNFGAVESEHHKQLKNFIAANPTTLGLPASTPNGKTEFDLPSGDTVDVMFKTDKQWTAVEVKSHISPEYDLIRGLYQCVKYKAVLKAFLSYQYPNARARTVLVVGKPFPKSLIPLRNLLGIEVLIHPSS